MTKQEPRGIRNNNPGNIRHSSDKWQGKAAVQKDKEFVTFETPIYGIRALARVLISYQDRHNLDTVAGIVRRWAPPNENATQEYILSVARRMNVGSDQNIDVHQYRYMRPLVEAIIHHENGQQPYTSAQIDKALVLAGVEPLAKSLASSRTMAGGAVAAVATAGGAVAETFPDLVGEIKAALEPLSWSFAWAQYAVLGLTLAGVGYMLWARWDDHRRGLR